MESLVARPHFGPMPSLEREITDFDADVMQRSHQRLVLAAFWAPWCTTCTLLHPALDHIAAARGTSLALVSINIEMHPELLAREGVAGLPLVKAYCKGVAIGELKGVLPEPALERWVDSLFDAALEGGLLRRGPAVRKSTQ
jgi:thioredoxin-like negative regulator of GroEL